MTINTITSEANDSPPTPPELSVMKQVRALLPTRVLTYPEALQRAELQASRLLSLHTVTHPPVPTEIVTQLPRIRIVQSYDLPASGSAHWDGHDWVITLNAAEHDLRQRFSLLHEFKHLLDHPTRHLIQGDASAKLTAEQMAERVADAFAACVLMPKTWIKHAYFNQGIQSIDALADLFQVSQKAMSIRLSQLGMTMPLQRCESQSTPGNTSTGTSRYAQRRQRYFRSLSRSNFALEGVRQWNL